MTGLHEQENFLPKPQLLLVIITLGTVLFVINIDHNGLSTLLPTIAEDLGAQESVTWAGSSALIATTIASVLYGRFSDIFGRKAMFISALSVFSVAEMACGFAVNPPMFYGLRALTGASGGGIGNLATIIATDVVSLRQRGQYMAVIAPFMLMGNVCGPLLAAGFLKRSANYHIPLSRRIDQQYH
jgi:MFS family permease